MRLFLLLVLPLLLPAQTSTAPAPTAPPPNAPNLSDPEMNQALADYLNNNQKISPADRKVLVEAFKEAVAQGARLTTPKVNDVVGLHAVLLPYDVCTRVFGKETAEHYAAIEILVSNRSDEANLIVHSLFSDLSHWLLAGGGLSLQRALGNAGSEEAVGQPGEIASVEYRAVRGQLLTRQPYTARNRLIAGLKLAGTIAAAYQFSLAEKGFIRGIAAFNGQVIPGAETFWPDDTILQANRISDLGFRVNTVVAQQSSEVIVAFYPLKRFLPAGFRDIFKREPALFFAPASIAVDSKARQVVQKYAPDVLTMVNLEYIRRAFYALVAMQRITSPEEKSAYVNQQSPEVQLGIRDVGVLNSISLNAIRIGVSGVMTIDVESIPPILQDIVMDDAKSPQTWLEAGEHTGTLTGRFLTGAAIEVAIPADSGATAEVVTSGSTDTKLKFKLKTTKPIQTGTVVSFRLSKEIKKGDKKTTAFSAPYLVQVTFDPPKPAITKLTKNADVVTVTGSNFLDLGDGNFAVQLVPSLAASGVVVRSVPAAALTRKPTQLDIDLTKITPALGDACWSVQVQLDAARTSTAKESFAVAATTTPAKCK